jgi:hypothetical protein
MSKIRRPDKPHSPFNDGQDLPPAGPHGRPALMDEEKTPGAGLRPIGIDKDGNLRPTS